MTDIEENEKQGQILLMFKEIAAKTFKEGGEKSQALAVASQAASFAGYAIELFESREKSLAPPACKAGCHYCCFYQVWLTPPEAFLIGRHIDEAYSGEAKQALMKRIEKTLRLTSGKSAEERARTWHQTPCLFLSEGRCSVYHVRPLVCRAVHALDRNQCREAFESSSRMAEIEGYSHRYHVFQSVKQGLKEVCSDMGCHMGDAPMAKAIQHYMSHADPIGAWIRGEDPCPGPVKT